MSDGSLIVMQWLLDPALTLDARGDPVRTERQASAEAIQRDIDKTLWIDAAGQKITCVSWRLIDNADVPTDRTFRNAWRDTGTITTDMPVAREIHREKLRRLRRPKLLELDVEYMKALEDGDTAATKRIAKQKQELRDVTDDPAIEKAKTPKALKAVIPSGLGD